MTASTPKQFPPLIGVGLIMLLACSLYLPFLDNPPVFDDAFLFSGRHFFYYATHPFGFQLRVPPYFSFASAHVLTGSMEVNRILSLAFHIACSLALYKLIYDLLRTVRDTDRTGSAPGTELHAATWAFISAAVFAIHPVAVYGAAYLVQRTIVLATLFSLLSVILFQRGLARGSHVDALSAALLYSVAVLCKEHAVLLPAVAVLTAALVPCERRFAIRHTLIYLLACTPAAIFVTLLAKGVIGSAYEPDFEIVGFQMENVFGFDIAQFPLLRSAAIQAGLFFNYFALWLWPDTRAMSVDIRVDFVETWAPIWTVLKAVAFIAYGVIGFLLLKRRGRAGLIGFGLLYAWILFLVEFTAARFQEPFVLYRSYLWAPGILLAFGALLSRFPYRAALAAFAIAGPVLLYQAHDRLVTFSSTFLLWKDAAAKLPDKPIPWGSRTLYNVGREYMRAGHPDRAIEIVERCLAQYPDTYHCYFARGAIHLELEEFEQALPYLARAVTLNPDSGLAYHRLGQALEKLDRIQEAKALYRRASQLGFKGADLEINRLEAPGGGLRPPKSTSPSTR